MRKKSILKPEIPISNKTINKFKIYERNYKKADSETLTRDSK